MDNNEFQAHTQRVEKLVQRVSALPDENARAAALELLQAVMDFHGATLSRIVELLSGSEVYRVSLAKLATDPLICGLLVLYGIHPLPLEQRVTEGIEKLRSQLQKQGAEVELLEVGNERVRVRVQSRTHGLAASPEKLRHAVEQAILEAAPEIAHVTIEGIAPAGFVPLDQVQTVTKENVYEESTARY
jgi:Fe-S cluster biogenesis protein NfuA